VSDFLDRFEQNYRNENDPWQVGESDEDGMVMIYRVRENIPAHVEIAQYPNLICVVWEYENKLGNGLPDSEIAEQQAVFEEALDEFIDAGGANEHMVVVTGNGRKEWLWYAKNPDHWIEGFSAALSDHPPFPVEIQGYDAEGWQAYDDLKQAMSANETDSESDSDDA